MSNPMFSSDVVITGGAFTQYNDNRRIAKDPFERLQEAASPTAFHDSGDRRDPPKCHPNTRVAVLEKIINWIAGLDPETVNALIMWLHGPAGSGKSAIAHTVADRCFKEQNLLASYFFSRFDSSRNHPRSLIATIAYQAATYLPGVRDRIVSRIDTDPLIFSRSMETQIVSLLIEPLQHLISSGYFNEPKSMRLIIIDGLDECEDRDGQLNILHTISNTLRQYHLPLIFLIASRPEHDITYAFGAGHLREISTRFPLDNEYESSSDIALFLKDQFAEIKETHPFKAQIPPDWPTKDVLGQLVKKSSGQFIYASTVVKFVKSTRHRPSNRLDIVLGLHPAAAVRDMPFAELDALYHHVFASVQDLDAVLQILALEVLSRRNVQYAVDEMEEILSLNPGEIRLMLSDLYSIIDIDESEYLHFLHASLEDFFLDKFRSKNLYIDAPLRHSEFAHIICQYIQKMPSSGPISRKIFKKLALHIKLALPHDHLRQDIKSLDITQYFSLIDDFHIGEFFWYMPHFLESIKQSQFDDAAELYAYHIRSFDRYAIRQLQIYQIYHSDPRLVSVLAVVGCGINSWSYRAPTSDLFQINDSLQHIDKGGLRLLEAMSFPPSADFMNNTRPKYLQFFREFLIDKERSGVYAPGGETYANAALYFLKYTCDHSPSSHKHTGRYTNGQILSMKNTPWKWHAFERKVTRKELSRLSKRFSAHNWDPLVPLAQWTTNWDSLDYSLARSVEPFLFALRCLPKILRVATRSDELIDLARRRAFGPLSLVFQDATKDARMAITCYLERTDSGDP